jgi:hypothetical protein
MTRTKVALFGWYMHGNFGDDLMAILFARAIKSAGFHPVAYRLPPQIAESEHIESADTIASLLEGASACVLGGGGLLVSAEDPPSPALMAFDEHLGQIANFCRSQSIPVWGASIGGTGAGRAGNLYPGLATLLSSGVMSGVTLRLERDKPLLDAFGIPSEHFPDVVFLAPEFWPANQTHAPRRLVLTHHLGKQPAGSAFVRALGLCGPPLLGLRTADVVTRHLSTYDRPWSPGDRRVPYTDVQGMADLVSQAKAVISSRLHLGIFAMAYGALFFSYGGKAKTTAQLEELGLDSHILSRGDLLSFLIRLRGGYAVEQAVIARMLPGLRKAARGHLLALKAFLASTRSAPHMSARPVLGRRHSDTSVGSHLSLAPHPRRSQESA